VVALSLEGLAAGLAILALLTLFSLARGACSVAYKDVLGKTIPKTRRGRLSGWISSFAGFATMATGGVLTLLPDSGGLGLYAGLLLVAAGRRLAAAGAYSRIVQYPGATEGVANRFIEAKPRLPLARAHAPVRRS